MVDPASKTTLHFRREQIGYFTSPYPDAKPVYEPQFPVACPYCGDIVDDSNVRTTSVAYMKDRQVSAFIRSNRRCNDADTANALDEVVLNTIEAMVKSGEIAP